MCVWREGRFGTYRIPDRELEVIPQSDRDSGIWNCTTGETQRVIFLIGVVRTQGKRGGAYPFPTRYALGEIGLGGWQETENAGPKCDPEKGGVICREPHDARDSQAGQSQNERAWTCKGRNARMARRRKQTEHGTGSWKWERVKEG